MSRPVRVTLPTGGWWDVETRPTWAQVMEWARWAADGDSLPERVLAQLTLGWSFLERVGFDALSRRSAADVAAAMDAVERLAAPLADARSSKEMAEGLFEGLVAGRIPEDFADVHLMASTGWSYDELLRTPADVVERMATYLSVRAAYETGGAMEVEGNGDGR